MLLTRPLCNREFPNSKTTIDNVFLSLNLNQARVLLCINKTAPIKATSVQWPKHVYISHCAQNPQVCDWGKTVGKPQT